MPSSGRPTHPPRTRSREAFDTIVDEGAQRLHRTWREVLTTGLAGGLEVAMGVLALFAVYAETGSHLLAGLAFSIGFIALLLARSELFTEGFLVPVTAVVAGRAGIGQLGQALGRHAGGQPGRGLAGHVAGGHAFPELGSDRDRVRRALRRRAAGPAVGLPGVPRRAA